MTAPNEPHTGYIVSLNLANTYGNGDLINSTQAHAAIEAAFIAASEASSAPPGAIILQQYFWADQTSLDSLIGTLNTLSKAQVWQRVRQVSFDIDIKNRMDLEGRFGDSVVLYDTSIYKGEACLVENTRSYSANEYLGVLQSSDATAAQESKYHGSWAGVKLTVLNPSTGGPTNAQFWLASYRVDRQYAVIIRKMELGNLFLKELATVSGSSSSSSNSDGRCLPALVGGGWNVKSYDFHVACPPVVPSESSQLQWEASVVLPNEGDAKKDTTDYFVAVNFTSTTTPCTSYELKITKDTVLPLPEDIARPFAHSPLVASFTLVEKQLSQAAPAAAPQYATQPLNPSSVDGAVLVSTRCHDTNLNSRLAKNGPLQESYKSAIVMVDGAPDAAMVMQVRTNNRKYTVGDSKKMLAVSLNDAWPAMKKYFCFEDWQKDRVLALFLGQGTRESTLCIDIETGTGKGYGLDPAHAYGLLQTAVTAFAGAAQMYNYEDEDDVPELKHYEWTPENFYDPMISSFMGFRKMCHFAIQARTKYNVTDNWEVLRLAIQAHNTGHANPGNDDGYMANYPDMIARMGEFYFIEGHLEDDVFTWTDHTSKVWDGDTSYYPAPATGAAWKENWKWLWTQ